MSKINYVKGDATNPQGEGNKVIAHVCNNKGKWGAGFVLALSKKWSEPETEYRAIPPKYHELGFVQFVRVEEDITVANMIAQQDVKSNENERPLRYDALIDALIKVNEYCQKRQCTLHMPKIGSGLAGGNWNIIEKIIEENVQVPVTVYEFE